MTTLQERIDDYSSHFVHRKPKGKREFYFLTIRPLVNAFKDGHAKARIVRVMVYTTLRLGIHKDASFSVAALDFRLDSWADIESHGLTPSVENVHPAFLLFSQRGFRKSDLMARDSLMVERGMDYVSATEEQHRVILRRNEPLRKRGGRA